MNSRDRHTRYGWMFFIGTLMALVIVGLCAHISEGAPGTWNKRLVFDYPGGDSVFWRVYDVMGDSLRDSIPADLPAATTISLSTDSMYEIDMGFNKIISTTDWFYSPPSPVMPYAGYLADSSVLNLGGLYITGGDSTTAAFNVNNVEGPATIFQTSGDGDFSYAFGQIAYGNSDAANYAWSETGSAHKWGGKGDYTWWIYNSGDTDITHKAGQAVHWNTVSAPGAGDVWEIVAGGTDTLRQNYAVEIEGSQYWHGRDDRSEHALYLLGSKDGHGFYVVSQETYGARFSNIDGTANGILVANGMRVDDSLYSPIIKTVIASTDTGEIKTLAANNPDLFYGPSATGTGTEAWQIVAYDTSISQPVTGAKLTITPIGGGTGIINTTVEGGKLNVLVDLDTFSVYCTHPSNFFAAETLVVAADGQVDTIEGYQWAVTIPIPAQSTMATVFLTYYRHGTAQIGTYLTVNNFNVAQDTVNDATIGPIYKWMRTNSNGIAYVEVPRSYVFHDSLKSLYDITIKERGTIIYEWEDLYIPDVDTFRLTIQD